MQVPHTSATQSGVALCPARAVADERNVSPGHTSCHAGNSARRFAMDSQPGLLTTRSHDHNQRVSFAPSLWEGELETKPQTSGSQWHLASAFDRTRTSFVPLLYDSPVKWETSLHPGEEAGGEGRRRHSTSTALRGISLLQPAAASVITTSSYQTATSMKVPLPAQQNPVLWARSHHWWVAR